MTDKPEALVLADIWRDFAIAADAVQGDPMMRTEAELRRLHEVETRAMVQPVGEVPVPEVQFPMPDRTLYGPDRTVSGHVYTAAKVRAYGDARYQQGYAAGVAAGGKDAERYRWLRDGTNWPAAFARHDAPEPLIGVDLDAAIDAALTEGDVK